MTPPASGLRACSTPPRCWPRWPTSWSSAPSVTPTWPGPTGSTARCDAADPRRVACPRRSTAASPAASTPGSARACGPPRAGSARSPSATSARPSRTRPRGRFLTSAVNGLIGDRLARERPRLAVPLAVRRDGRDVPAGHRCPGDGVPVRDRPDRDPAPRAVARTSRPSTGTATASARRTPTRWPSWAGRRSCSAPTPGSTLRENGVALAALLGRWSTPGRSRSSGIALVGHSMGGLFCAPPARSPPTPSRPWDAPSPTSSPSGPLTSARRWPGASGAGARALGRLPESAAFGRILDQRSVGVLDLVDGLGDDATAAAARALPPGLRHPHPVAAAPGGLVPRATAWCANPRRTATPDAAARAVPGRRPSPPARRRSLRPAQPSPGPRGPATVAGGPAWRRRICCRRTAPHHAWKRRPIRLGSQT